MSIPEGNLKVDVVVIGGGIAGLWTLHRLLAVGYDAVLVEKCALGSGQTIASQGVIHGGLKYALNGVLNDASETIGAMPAIWDACLRGEGEIDLSKVRLLSQRQYLFSKSVLASKLALFFASKALGGRSAAVPKQDWPEVFRTSGFRGNVFQLEEKVLDVTTLIQELARPVLGRIIWLEDYRLRPGASGGVLVESGTTKIQASRAVLCAGAGNEALVEQLGASTKIRMQRRPLHQVVVRSERLPELYGVAIGQGPKPPFVVTSHTTPHGRVWYLGGELAESGVARDEAAQVEVAHRIVTAFFPKLDLGDATWGLLRVDRAEGFTEGATRPKGPVCLRTGDVLAVWPTKLVMAPLAARMVLETLGQPENGCTAQRTFLHVPHVARPFWEETRWIH